MNDDLLKSNITVFSKNFEYCTLFIALFLSFFKICGFINYPWWIILSFLWIPEAFVILLSFIVITAGIFIIKLFFILVCIMNAIRILFAM